MATSKHLRPSKAAIWMKCAAFVQMSDAAPERDGDYTVREEGTACHWVCEQRLVGEAVEVGKMAPNAVEVDADMLETAEQYAAHVHGWGGLGLHIEAPVSMGDAFPLLQDGTADAWAYDADAGVLHVIDLKYGYRPVEAIRNPQLAIYAYAIARALPALPTRVEMSIFQPRASHPAGKMRTWSATTRELAAFAAKINEAALATKQVPPTAHPGSHCMYCDGAVGCRALADASAQMLDICDRTEGYYDEPSNAQVAFDLRAVTAAMAILDARKTALELYAEKALSQGEVVPGWEMRRSAGRWKWRAGVEDALKQLGALYGVEVTTESLRTPHSLQKDIKGFDVHVYAEKQDGKLKLALVDPEQAKRAFGTLK